jgi:hypothetical protein
MPAIDGEFLVVKKIDEEEKEMVRQWHSKPEVHFVGSHTGCGCGFPSVVVRGPIDYSEALELFEENDDRQKDITSLAELRDFIQAHVAQGEVVQLYSVWYNTDRAPLGVVRLGLQNMEPEKFIFVEGYVYEITAEQGVVADGSRLHFCPLKTEYV